MAQATTGDHVSLNVTLSIPRSQLKLLQAQERVMAQLPFATDQGGPALKLWTPEELRVQSSESREEGLGHRMSYPVLQPASLFAGLAESHQTGPQRLSAEEAERVRTSLTLPEFYNLHMAPWRARQLEDGKVKSGTLSRERNALNRWLKWELGAQPTDWPVTTEWRGLPIGYLAGGYLDKFYAWMSPPRYAVCSVKSTRCHLQAVLNHAVKIGVLDQAPKSAALDLEDPEDVEEDLATIWTAEEVGRLYQAMRGNFDLQVAFALSINCGARSSDLFLMRWEKNIRLDEDQPMVRFRAKKTGKKHGIPLHPLTVSHLRKLRKEQLCETDGLLFPRLTAARNKDPERSRAARQRTKLTKRLMQIAELPVHNKPWQVTRATCCSLLDNVDRTAKVGSWVIGQAETSGTRLGDTFYSNPAAVVVETILKAPWPLKAV